MRHAVAYMLLGLLLLAACGERRAETAPRPPLAALQADLVDPDPEVRMAAATHLYEMGVEKSLSDAVVPDLASALSDENRWVRDRAARALGELGPAALPALESLIAALHDEDGFVRFRAARALWAIGPDAAPAVGRLQAMAEADSETEIGRYWAARALERIRPE